MGVDHESFNPKNFNKNYKETIGSENLLLLGVGRLALKKVLII